MVCKGRVQNGVIVIEGDMRLPEGAEVRIETVAPSATATLYDRFRDVIGKAVDLPDDLAEQHDHYLYGVPKS
jgi:hypothetical protein